MQSFKMAKNFNMVCVTLFLLGLAFRLILVGGSSIGVCYGMNGDNLPTPKEVVTTCKSYKIKRIRLYEPNITILEPLRKSSIEVLMGMRNEQLPYLASTYIATHNWVKKYIISYWPDVRFRYISVGNEAFPGPYANYVYPVMHYLRTALINESLYNYIKVSTAVSTSVMSVYNPPSAGVFSKDAAKFMKDIAQYLRENDTPLLANIHPYYAYIKDPKHISLQYALFLSPRIVVPDENYGYQNLFEAMVDALYVSLHKMGEPRVQIVVSETGWPTGENSKVTTPAVARLYVSNVVKHVLSTRGTPRRRGKIETYLYSMFDETKTQGTKEEEHWGLFDPNNKKPVYDISFLIDQ